MIILNDKIRAIGKKKINQESKVQDTGFIVTNPFALRALEPSVRWFFLRYGNRPSMILV
jgi:flagellar assembly factor FliW